MNVNMPSDHAKSRTVPIRVAIILFERTKLLDVCGPLQVFVDARGPDGCSAYAVDLVSERGGPVTTDAGVALMTCSFADFVPPPWDTVLISGGSSAHEAARSLPLLQLVATAAQTCRRLGSVCSGAFILAAGGHLDGRRATTHWEDCALLGRDYPRTDVAMNAIYVADRGVWTSAGVTAGIDMALAMVEADFGRSEALRLAKSLVLPVRRTGGQNQFSMALAAQTASRDTRFAELVSQMLANPQQDLSVPALAGMAGMSPRNFSRVFTLEMGASPARFVERLRVDLACELMHQGRTSLKAIPTLVGFADAERMRCAFQKVKGLSPSNYQRQFGPEPA